MGRDEQRHSSHSLPRDTAIPQNLGQEAICSHAMPCLAALNTTLSKRLVFVYQRRDVVSNPQTAVSAALLAAPNLPRAALGALLGVSFPRWRITSYFKWWVRGNRNITDEERRSHREPEVSFLFSPKRAQHQTPACFFLNEESGSNQCGATMHFAEIKAQYQSPNVAPSSVGPPDLTQPFRDQLS